MLAHGRVLCNRSHKRLSWAALEALYYCTRWRARGDHSRSATAPQQPLRSQYWSARRTSSSSLALIARIYTTYIYIKVICGSLFSLLSLCCSLCLSLGSSFSLSVHRSKRSIIFYILRSRQGSTTTAFSAYLHLGGPLCLSALPQLALPANIASKIVLVYEYDILLAIFCWRYLLAKFLPYTENCSVYE